MNVTFTLLLLVAALATVLACAWLYRNRGKACFMANTNIAPSAGRAATGIKSYKADAAIARNMLVVRGAGTPTSEYVKIGAGATEKPLGIALDEAEEAGDVIAVAVLGACVGTQLVVAGAAITIDDWVQSNGDGKVKTLVATGYAVGRALNAALGDGDLVEIAPVGIATLAAV